MKNILLVILLLVFFSLSCSKPTEPQPNKASLTLKLEDVSCTEAWIKLSANNLPLPSTVVIKQNDLTRATINLNTNDTLLYVDSLLPKQTYKFKPVLQTTNTPQPIANELSITTMDTTSHNFTWQTWTFGTISSGLRDVAIIDENNIWAVGQIKIADTSINGYTTYNAVHWNGSEWKLKKIGGQGGWACGTVFAFSANDVWFNGTIKWDGEKYTVHKNGWPLLPNGDGWRVNKMWGSSSNDLYAVGNGGNIAHWDGVRWRKIEGDNSSNIQSIYGSKTSNNKYEIIAIASEEFSNLPTTIMKIEPQNNSVQILPHNLRPGMMDIWFVSKRKYISVGDGVYSTNNIDRSNSWKREVSFSTNMWFTLAIDGEKYNDIVISGVSGEILHFNGSRWRNLSSQIQLAGINRLFECKIKNGLIVLVGISYVGQAVIIMGKRN